MFMQGFRIKKMILLNTLDPFVRKLRRKIYAGDGKYSYKKNS
jgi:hypothetical protein